MNQSDDAYRSLQRQLDEAARLCRPVDPGWETLVERLPPREPDHGSPGETQPSRPAAKRSPVRWMAPVLAAAVLIAAMLGFLQWPWWEGPALATTLPIEVRRRGIQVTVFSKSEIREPTLFMPLVAPVQPAFAPNQGPQQMEVQQSLRQMPVQQRAINAGRPMQIDAQVGSQVTMQTQVLPIMQQSPGMALVKDERLVLHLRKGDNLVRFTDVAASIDPTSVRLVSDTDPTGTKVVEQNFEFDLASADALLKRTLERQITCVGKEEGELYEGYLLSFDSETVILADRKPSDDPKAKRPKTQAIARDKLQAIRIREMPDDLYTRPTLVWKLRTATPGDHLTTLTYLCGNVVWRADYVAVITETGPDGDTLDLNGWVTIDNRSGTTYEDAGLKLIAGDVNRVRDPWAVVAQERFNFFIGFDCGVPANQPSSHEKKEFTQKSFFEYKLYTLSRPSTIKDRQIKQLGLFQASGIRALRRFVCQSNEGPVQHPEVQLLVQNEKANNLGRPLPKGMVAITALDDDGDSQLLGRQAIDHTPKDEEVEIAMGRAFDVVYGYRVVETKRPASHRMIQTYEFRVRNHKPTAVDVRTVGALAGHTNWTVTQSSDPFTKHDFQTLHFDFRLEADTEKTITYTVDYRW